MNRTPEKELLPPQWRKDLVLGAFIFMSGLFIGIDIARAPRTPEVELPPVVAMAPDTADYDIRSDSAFRALVDHICAVEGYRSHPYSDVRGSIAIGCGLNLTFHGFTPKIARDAAADVLVEVRNGITKGWPPFASMPQPVQFGLMDAGYNMGVHNLLQFDETLRAMARGDVSGTIEGIRDSDWYRDDRTQSRAEALITIVRGNL